MSWEPLPLKNDPLSDAQKLQIQAFVDSHLLTQEDVPICDYYSKAVRGYRKKHLLENKSYALFHALAKSWDGYKPEALLEIRTLYDAYHQGQKSFDLFRRVFKNPAENDSELGIDPNRTDQIFAAQTFMKVVIRKYERSHGDFKELKSYYRNKMASVKGADDGYEASPKNRLLMLGDPIKKNSQPTTPLDAILTNTHFLVPVSKSTLTYTHPDGTTTTTETEHGPTREEARQLLHGEFTRLYNLPEIQHVLQALGTLIQKERGNILISNTTFGPGSLGTTYGAKTNLLGGVHAFYTNCHTLVLASLINPYDKKLCGHSSGSFIHEALHFLFNRLVKNCSSPVSPNTPEEKLLDEALAKDRAHRQTIDRKQLTSPESSVWSTLVEDLEKDPEYFRTGGLFPLTPQEIMRIEAIVRVMEQAASGVPISSIRKIAPHLCDFYFQHSKPLIEKFITDNSSLFSPPPAPIPTSTSSHSVLTPPPLKSAAPPSLSLYGRIKAIPLFIFDKLITLIHRLFQFLNKK